MSKKCPVILPKMSQSGKKLSNKKVNKFSGMSIKCPVMPQNVYKMSKNVQKSQILSQKKKKCASPPGSGHHATGGRSSNPPSPLPPLPHPTPPLHTPRGAPLPSHLLLTSLSLLPSSPPFNPPLPFQVDPLMSLTGQQMSAPRLPSAVQRSAGPPCRAPGEDEN
jgi:hypothetical protein